MDMFDPITYFLFVLMDFFSIRPSKICGRISSKTRPQQSTLMKETRHEVQEQWAFLFITRVIKAMTKIRKTSL